MKIPGFPSLRKLWIIYKAWLIWHYLPASYIEIYKVVKK